MGKIVLYDNDYEGAILCVGDKKDSADLNHVSQKDLDNLLKYANRSLGDIIKKDNLLMFPMFHDKTQATLLELPLLTIQDHQYLGHKCQSLRVKTGNLMGFIGINGTELEIRSRFSPTGEGQDYFLYYMLQKVCRINTVNLSHRTSYATNKLNLMMLLFPQMLKAALFQGVYKEYRTFAYNDNRVKGVIDVNRFIQHDIPFHGCIAYRCRKYSTDNHITQLIRHAIEQILRSTWGKQLLSIDADMKTAVQTIINVTPSYSPRLRQEVINTNAKVVCHPYYTKYRPLQELCLKLLRHQSLQYGKQKDKIEGVLFDGAWLWEEYLATILCQHGFEHPRNKEGSGRIQIFTDNNNMPCYPDYYNDTCIADAKYKRLGTNGIPRGDVYQIISYMHVMNRNKGFFLCPDSVSREILGTVNGMGGDLHVLGMNIPQKEQDFSQFCKQMEQQEKTMIETLHQYL